MKWLKFVTKKHNFQKNTEKPIRKESNPKKRSNNPNTHLWVTHKLRSEEYASCCFFSLQLKHLTCAIGKGTSGTLGPPISFMLPNTKNVSFCIRRTHLGSLVIWSIVSQSRGSRICFVFLILKTDLVLHMLCYFVCLWFANIKRYGTLGWNFRGFFFIHSLRRKTHTTQITMPSELQSLFYSIFQTEQRRCLI